MSAPITDAIPLTPEQVKALLDSLEEDPSSVEEDPYGRVEGAEEEASPRIDGRRFNQGNPHPIGRRPDGNKQYQIKHVWDNHQEIMRRLAIGEKPIEIARAMGISRQTVTAVARSKITRERIDELHAAMNGEVIDIGKRIRAFAPIALKVQEELVMDERVSPAVRASLSGSLLDRAGYAPVKQVDLTARFGLAPDILEDVKKRSREITENRLNRIEDAHFTEGS